MLYILTTRFQDWLDAVGLYRVIQVCTQLEFRAIAALLTSFLVVLAFAPRTIARLRRLKVGDNPEFYNAALNTLNQSKSGTPTMGGVLIAGAILAAMLLFADIVYSRYVHLAVVLLLVFGGLGAFDDWLKLTAARRGTGTREGLFAWEKLVFQLGCGGLVAAFLYAAGEPAANPAAASLNLPFQRTYEPSTLFDVAGAALNPNVVILGGVAFVLIGAFAIAGTSNAVNIADGMDGLAAGTMTIASLVLMVLCWISANKAAAEHLLVPHVPGARELMVLSGAMAGACLGFLWFNCNPARVFMGDTGSLPLGALLAFVAVAIRQELLLALVAGVFYVELASSALQIGYFRISGGKRIFRCAPIHHHFHLGGWGENQVVVRFWIVTAMLGALALVSIKLR
jgi:phospho-N-acetylmuramoyl-pentapeptide-transferase